MVDILGSNDNGVAKQQKTYVEDHQKPGLDASIVPKGIPAH